MGELEKELYDGANSPIMPRRAFLKYSVGAGLALAGIPLFSGCVSRGDTRITPAPVAPHVQFFRDYAELGYGFTSVDEDWARNYLDTFGKEWFKSHPELHETLNAKIRQERLILSEKLGQSFSAVQDIVGANWDYHYELYKDGNSLLPLDSVAMRTDFPNREDREIIYRGMWMPNSLSFVDVNFNDFIDVTKPNIEILKKNLEILVDDTIRNRVIRAYENLEYDDGKHRLAGEYSDHYEARYFYEGRWSSFARDPTFGFQNTGKMFGEVYDPLLQKMGGKIVDMERFIYGLAEIDSKYEQHDIYIANIYSKAIGCATFEQRGNYPSVAKFSGYHQAVAMPVQKHIVDEIKNNPSKYGTPIIGPGQTISLYCAKEPLIADKVPYVDQILPTVESVRLFEL